MMLTGSSGSRIRRLTVAGASTPAALIMSAAAAYGYLAIAAHMLGSDRFGAIAALWSAVFLVVVGILVPLEQELARATATRRARSDGLGPLIVGAGRVTFIVGGSLAGLAVLAAPLLVEPMFDGDWIMVLALAMAVGGFAFGAIAKGISAGLGRLDRWSAYLVVDGGLRLAACALLALTGVDQPAAYGVVLAVTPWLAGLWTLRHQRRALREPGPPCNASDLWRGFGLLIIGAIGGAWLANAAPLGVALLAAPAERALVGPFLAALVLARVPLFAFQAVQARFLPRLALLLAADRLDEARSTLRRLTIGTALLAVLGVVAAAWLGPLAGRAVFGESFVVEHRTTAMLALATGGWLLAAVLSQGLIAAERHGRVAIGWLVAALLGTGVTLLSSTHLLWRVELGIVTGSLAAATLMAVALRGFGGTLVEAVNGRTGLHSPRRTATDGLQGGRS